MGIRAMMFFAQALGMHEDIKSKNEEKIEEARKLYWDACKYPRKKKKAMRKQAIKDFNFWSSLSEYFNKTFDF